MNIKHYHDGELKKMIIELANQNDIKDMYGRNPEEMAESFLSYTPLGRQLILDWYSGLEKTQKKMNWIAKNGFEHKYFYISGIDAAVAMLLLGYTVDSDRRANITKKSMDCLNKYGHKCYESRFSFFDKYNLHSRDINFMWEELFDKKQKEKQT